MHRFKKLAPALRSTFVSLKYKNFRSFWIGQCVSLTGTWMQRTAMVWLVYTITKSPFLVGVLGVCQFMPLLLFTLFAGVFVDRFQKRNILIVTQTTFMILGFTSTALIFFGVVRYWELLVITVLFGLTQTVDMPARQSFFIELVGKKDVMNAISLNSTIFNLAKIVGPALSGIVMVKFGTGFCFLANSVSYIAVLIGLFRIHTENDVSQRFRRHIVQEIVDGLNYIRHSETLVVNSLLMAVVCTFAFNNDVIVPVFAKTVLGRGAAGYTGLMSAAGVGSFAGAIFMAAVARYGINKRLFIFDALVSSAMQILMVFARSYPAALAMLAVVGFVNLSFLNLCNSIFQVHTSAEYRGRVMSVYAFLNQGTTPVGNFFAGAVMERFGGISGFPACGAAVLLLLIPVFALKKRTLRAWLKRRGA